MRSLWSALLPDWIGSNMRVILAARLGMSVARAMTSIVTALYLAAIGFSAIEIGVLVVGVTVVAALMSTAIGLLADHWGRKPFLVALPLMVAAACLIYSEYRVTAVLFAAAALGSFGRGSGAGAGDIGPYQPAESALVADSIDAGRRPAAFARVTFVASVGALIGGLLAQVVHTTPHMTGAEATAAYRPAYLVAAVLAAAAGTLALRLKEAPHPVAERVGRRITCRWPHRSWPALWRLGVINATDGVAIGLFGPFVGYWLYRRYGATPGSIGVLFALVNLASLASALTAARVAGRLGTVRAITAIRAVGGVLLALMVLAPAFWVAGAIYLVRMVVQRIGLPLRQSFTQDVADPEERASVAAISYLPAQVTTAAGQALAGYLFDEVSLAAPFQLAGVFQVINALLYPVLFSFRTRPRDASREAV